MDVDMEAVRHRALRLGMLVDAQTIRERVLQGDGVFSCQILLTALIKGDNGIRKRILHDVEPRYFGTGHSWELIFAWISQALESNGSVDVAELYQKEEEFVRTVFWPDYQHYVDQVLAIEVPDPQTLKEAIALLRARQYREPEPTSANTDALLAERIVLAALIKGDLETRKRVIGELGAQYNDYLWHSVHGTMYERLYELFETKDRIADNEVTTTMRNYVWTHVLPTYTASVDHVLSIEMPDSEMIDKAIAWLEKWHGGRIKP